MLLQAKICAPPTTADQRTQIYLKESVGRASRLVSNSSSIREWPVCPSTARMGRALLHRARFASKKGNRPFLIYHNAPSKPALLSLIHGGLLGLLTAPVQRGPLEAARCAVHSLAREQPACPSTARVGGGPSQAARSASKKDVRLLPVFLPLESFSHPLVKCRHSQLTCCFLNHSMSHT